MTSCYPRPRMPWSGVTGAIARCKNRSTACARKSRSVPVLRWTCGVKLKPKAVNKPSHHCIMHGLDKPGVFTTVSLGGINLCLDGLILTLFFGADVRIDGSKSACCVEGVWSWGLPWGLAICYDRL